MQRILLLLLVATVILAISGGAQDAAAQAKRSLEARQAQEQVNQVIAKVKAATDQAGGDPRAFVEALPPEVREGNEAAYEAILNLKPGESAARFTSENPNDPVRAVFSRQVQKLGRRYAPERNSLLLERQALSATTSQGSANWAFFKGHFLHPDLPPPYGTFKPNCENNWCVPDFYLSDYNEYDADWRRGNFCSYVPDFWFRWPCYQHDLAYTFTPMVADSKLGSFLAVNWQWYGDMRTECHEQISFDWLNPQFYMCQAVALTYYLVVNTLTFPTFNAPNEIKGYDVLNGVEPDPSSPLVHRRWNACTGKYTASRPYVSYNRSVLYTYADVPQGAILELSGTTHRGTRILFEFVDSNGITVANHLTAKAEDNCVIRQEPERFATAALPIGTYAVKAWYYAWESSGWQSDYAYDPVRYVTHGTPTHNEEVLTLNITQGGGGGGGGGGDCEFTRTGCLYSRGTQERR